MSYGGYTHGQYGSYGMPAFTQPYPSPYQYQLPPAFPYGLHHHTHGGPYYPPYGFQGYGYGVPLQWPYSQPYYPPASQFPGGIYGSATMPAPAYRGGDPHAFGSIYSSTLYTPGMWESNFNYQYGYGYNLFPQSLPFQHGLIFDAGQSLKTRKMAEKLEKEPSVKKLVAKARPNLYSSVPDFTQAAYNPSISFPITLYSSAESVLAAGPPGTIMMSPPPPPPPAFMDLTVASSTVRRSLSPVQLSSPTKVPTRSPAKPVSITASPLVVAKKPAATIQAKPAASPAATPTKPPPQASITPSPQASMAKPAAPQVSPPKPAARPPQDPKKTSTPDSKSVMGSVSSPTAEADRDMPPRKPLPAVPRSRDVSPERTPEKPKAAARGVVTPAKPLPQSTPKKDSPASVKAATTPASTKSKTATPSSVKSTASAHRLAGVGLLFARERSGWIVRQVIPGSPAGDTNHIKVGDNLWSIDGTEVGGMVSMFEVSKCLLGEEGTEVRLKFKRGKKAYNVPLIRSNEFLGQEGGSSAKKVLELGDGLQV